MNDHISKPVDPDQRYATQHIHVLGTLQVGIEAVLDGAGLAAEDHATQRFDYTENLFLVHEITIVLHTPCH